MEGKRRTDDKRNTGDERGTSESNIGKHGAGERHDAPA